MPYVWPTAVTTKTNAATRYKNVAFITPPQKAGTNPDWASFPNSVATLLLNFTAPLQRRHGIRKSPAVITVKTPASPQNPAVCVAPCDSTSPNSPAAASQNNADSSSESPEA